MLKSFSKEERSWIMYDWANSVFATIMLAAIFPVFFVQMAGGEGTQGSMWWGIGIVGARFLMGVAAPFIGTLVDYRGYKKRLLAIFIAFGILALLFVAAQSSWQMLLIGYVLANILWSGANLVYDSYLPDVTTKDRMDKVSSWGFAMGYIGGSTIPFLFAILLIMFGENFGIDGVMAVRLSVVITAVWWGAFSIPMLRNVRHKYGVDAPKKGLVGHTLRNIIDTARRIVKNKGMLVFIVAYFFYIDGVGTIINMATAYGAELQLDATMMILSLFIMQIVAVPFSILFGRLTKKINPITVIVCAICMYLLIVLTGFIMGFGLEVAWFDVDTAIIIFFVLAFMVGTVQGGIQAISRSTFGRLIPPESSGEYFGFYEIFGRFAAILGPGLYALVLHLTGRPSFSIISIGAVFVIGLTILLAGRKHLSASLRANEN
ncbi:MAG: MFS transporter [Clostridiales bacterium]|jgi:UMF1 family MFS transporter|nr:MFS transporter [Clostridiales bacterium]